MKEMNSESAEYFLHELFSRAGKQEKNYFMTSEQQRGYLARDGGRRFKRKAMGICGSKTIKTLDEIIKILVETNIASNNQEAKELVPQLIKATEVNPIGLEASIFDSRYMIFTKVKNSNAVEDLYEIRIWSG